MRVFFDTVGCRLNQAEIENLAAQFTAAGHVVLESPAGADLVVVNSCAVTNEAASDSRGKVRAAARQGAARIVITGCWATVDPAAAALLPGVSQVVPNQLKDSLVSRELHIPLEDLLTDSMLRAVLPGKRHRTRAFIKVQDGCDNHCTYCITRIARGQSRSLPVADILSSIHRAIAGGVNEVVLTGVHLGAWGLDLTPSDNLTTLIKTILAEVPVPRLRLSSIEPWDLDDSFIGLWQDARLMPHFHLPLQSGSTTVLRRMARNTTPDAFAALVERIRRQIPGAAITTDIIVGFPGETEGEYKESLAFVGEIEFSSGHVFRYSPRPGTAAANLPNRISPSLAHSRSSEMRAALDASRQAYEQQWVNRTVEVLWEQAHPLTDNNWMMTGLSGNYLTVQAISPAPAVNQIATVHLATVTTRGMFGSIVPG